LDKLGLDDPEMPKVSLAKASSSPKTLGFHDVSRNPLPHNSLLSVLLRLAVAGLNSRRNLFGRVP
jgi:hypothetical protein